MRFILRGVSVSGPGPGNPQDGPARPGDYLPNKLTWNRQNGSLNSRPIIIVMPVCNTIMTCKGK